MVHNIPHVLLKSQTADLSSLIEYLQNSVLESKDSDIVANQEYLLQLALYALEMGDFQERWEITKVLLRLGNIVIPSLIEILADEDAEEELRWYAARTLGEFQHPDAVTALVELLNSNDNEELKNIATAALGQMGKIGITALSKLLTREDSRVLAVRALAQIATTETIAPLLSVVQDCQPAIRAAAIEALSSFYDQRIPPILLQALDDEESIVRRIAVIALGFRADLFTLDLVRKLQNRLDDVDIDVCCAAAISLSRMGCDDAAKCLFQVLILPQTALTLQLETIRALGWMERESSLEYLQQAIDQVSLPVLWQEIVTVLGRVKKPHLTTLATDILLKLWRVKHPAINISSIKSAIALSLGKLGQTQSIETLVSMLADADAQVRLHAIAALKNISPEIANQQLR